MGFFSWNCKRCQMAIMNPYQVNEETSWLNDAVAITKDGSILKGSYDGYGRINDRDICMYDFDFEMYHNACWELEGKPTEFTSPSKRANNQGHFIGEEDPEWTAKNPLETA